MLMPKTFNAFNAEAKKAVNADAKDGVNKKNSVNNEQYTIIKKCTAFCISYFLTIYKIYGIYVFIYFRSGIKYYRIPVWDRLKTKEITQFLKNMKILFLAENYSENSSIPTAI